MHVDAVGCTESPWIGLLSQVVQSESHLACDLAKEVAVACQPPAQQAKVASIRATLRSRASPSSKDGRGLGGMRGQEAACWRRRGQGQGQDRLQDLGENITLLST